MLAGHTKFNLTASLDLLRKSTGVHQLHDLGRIVTESTIAGKNIPEYTCDTTTGQRNVTWYIQLDYIPGAVL